MKMKSLQNALLFFIAVAASSTLAAPVIPSGVLLPRHETRILARQQNITAPMSFQSVETSQTQVGTITQTCNVTLTPITGGNDNGSVQEDKDCSYSVVPSGQSAPPPPAPPSPAPPSTSGGGTDTVIAAPSDSHTTDSAAPPAQTASQSSTDGQATATATATTTTTTTTSPGPGNATTSSGVSSASVPNATSSSTSATGTASASASPATSASVSTPAASSGSPTPTALAAAGSPSTSAAPVTLTSTLSNGSLTTLTIPPTAAQAQASAGQEQVPGQKLEVLPIGLGVFAGVSVIALIVVGLVTYERTKYRKAFRQRKLAEDGANMGYGGMAERT